MEGGFEVIKVVAVHGVLFADRFGCVGGGWGVGAVEGGAAIELEDSVHEKVPAAVG